MEYMFPTDAEDRAVGAKALGGGWGRHYPRLVARGNDSPDALLNKFIQHVCANHPLERRRGESVNQTL